MTHQASTSDGLASRLAFPVFYGAGGALSFFLLWLVAILSACTPSRDKAEGHSDVDTLSAVVLQIKKCSRLYTTECRVHKIVTYDDALRIQGRIVGQNVNLPIPLGDRKVAIPMDATVKAYIDLSHVNRENVRLTPDGVLHLTLPQPVVVITDSKIDQKGIREYVALARAHFSDSELSDLERQGRQAILESVPRLGLEEQAREGAAQLLSPLLADLGFDESHVAFVFSDRVHRN